MKGYKKIQKQGALRNYFYLKMIPKLKTFDNYKFKQ